MTTTHSPAPRPDHASSAEARRRQTHELFSLARSTDSEVERKELYDAVVELHLDLAHGEAGRYRHRGIPLDDLRQVAALALTRATRRYDVTAGHDFLSYAVPTIRGELRKHFRDQGWMVRPPRRIQELQSRINAARETLAFELGRSPQPSDLAVHLGETVEAVVEAVASDGCFVPASLDRPVGADDLGTLGDLLPYDDRDFAVAEAQLMLRPLVARLSRRDQRILHLRFYEGLTQREIGDRLGVGQMQVSRLLSRILGQLRNRVGEVPQT